MKFCLIAGAAAIAAVTIVSAMPASFEIDETQLYSRTLLEAGMKATDELVDTASESLGSTSHGSSGAAETPEALKVIAKTNSKPSSASLQASKRVKTPWPTADFDINSLTDAELLELILDRPVGRQAGHWLKIPDERILQVLPPPLPAGPSYKYTPAQLARAKKLATIRGGIMHRRRARARRASNRIEVTTAPASFAQSLPQRARIVGSAKPEPPSKDAQARSEVPDLSQHSHSSGHNRLSLLADAADQQSFQEPTSRLHGEGTSLNTLRIDSMPPRSPPRGFDDFAQKRERVFLKLFGSASPPSSPSRADIPAQMATGLSPD